MIDLLLLLHVQSGSMHKIPSKHFNVTNSRMIDTTVCGPVSKITACFIKLLLKPCIAFNILVQTVVKLTVVNVMSFGQVSSNVRGQPVDVKSLNKTVPYQCVQHHFSWNVFGSYHNIHTLVHVYITIAATHVVIHWH